MKKVIFHFMVVGVTTCLCAIALYVAAYSYETKKIRSLKMYEITSLNSPIDISVFCNRFVHAALSMIIDPPIEAFIGQKSPPVTGVLSISIDGDVYKKNADIAGGAYYFSGKGVWLKNIEYFPPVLLGSCGSKMTVNIQELSVNLNKHRVFLQIRKDGRP